MHTEIGHHCIGAKVNGKLVALESTLDHGDVVEILTSKAEGAGPSRDWLEFVKSPRARTKIRQWFAKERREDAIDAGKTQLTRAMRKAALPLQRLMGGDALVTIARDMHLADVAALYAAVGEGHVSAQSVVHKLVAALGGEEGAVEDIAETALPSATSSAPADRRGGDTGVVVQGVSDVWIKLARCCTPVPGDDILGLRHPRRRGVRAPHGVYQRVVAAGPARAPGRGRVGRRRPRSRFVVSIQVEALDRHQLLSDVSRVLSDERVNILSATSAPTATAWRSASSPSSSPRPNTSGTCVRTIRGVEGVYDVYRVQASA